MCSFGAGEGEDGPGTVQGDLMVDYYAGYNCAHPGVKIWGELSGSSSNFSPGAHGLHVHASNGIADGCGGLGGHFQGGVDSIHGAPDFMLGERHAGDLGNIWIGDDNTATVYIEDHYLNLQEGSNLNIANVGMVLHALPDDFNPERSPTSTGAAGSRVGCCVFTPPPPPPEEPSFDGVSSLNIFFDIGPCTRVIFIYI